MVRTKQSTLFGILIQYITHEINGNQAVKNGPS